MKRIYLFFILSAVLCACEHDIATTADFNVLLDKSNVYKVGEPIRFNFNGDVDNILFYSGEQGSDYEYRDRYSVPMEDVRSVSLNLDMIASYGSPDAMEIYISNKFNGLKGDDAKADRDTLTKMYKNGMYGWTRLEYDEGASTILTKHVYDTLLAYKENFSLAFHWCPKSWSEKKDIKDQLNKTDTLKYLTQRTYWVSGTLNLDIKDVVNTSMDISELEFTTVMINKEIEDAYHKNDGNGSIITNKPESATLIFQGVGAADSLKYALDGWAISTPKPLNLVSNDKGIVIKNQQNYIHSYSYTWNEPGTYKVVFVGSNVNYSSESTMIKELTVTILEDIDNVKE